MTVYFLDSSTLVKRYIVENGTPWVRSVLRPGNHIIIAQVTPVEVMSAVARHLRDQTVAPRHARAIQAYVNRHAEREYVVVNLTKSVILSAQNALLKYTLRAYDAVQLASALEANGRLVGAGQPPLTFVCADTRLLTAAATEGLPTHNPV